MLAIRDTTQKHENHVSQDSSSISKTQEALVVVSMAATTVNISSTLGLTALYYPSGKKKKRKNLTLHNIIISVL